MFTDPAGPSKGSITSLSLLPSLYACAVGRRCGVVSVVMLPDVMQMTHYRLLPRAGAHDIPLAPTTQACMRVCCDANRNNTTERDNPKKRKKTTRKSQKKEMVTNIQYTNTYIYVDIHMDACLYTPLIHRLRV